MKNKKVLAIIIVLCVISTVSLAVTAFLLLKQTKPVNNPDIYPPVAADPNAKPIEEEDSNPPLENPEGGGAVSLTYSNQATAQKGNGVASMMFQNPARSNQSIVIQLHITDKELIEKIGKTGRTGEEKKKVEGAEGYDAEKSRMIIAESGKVAPGYKITQLQLKALPDGTILPKGTYNAVYYILAYDKETNERAIVNMQIPITLTIME
jgi:hypothetical protein